MMDKKVVIGGILKFASTWKTRSFLFFAFTPLGLGQFCQALKRMVLILYFT